MNRKTLLTVSLSLAFLIGGVHCAYSQTNYYSSTTEAGEVSGVVTTTSESETKNYNAYKTTWKKNRFKDTWYITFGSGAQILMGEDDDKGAFGSRITYAPSFTIGKFFSPIWGLRVNITGGSLHGFNDGHAGTYRKWNKGSENYLGKGYVSVIPGQSKPGYPQVAPNTAMTTWDPSWVGRGYTLHDPISNPNGQITYDGGSNTYQLGNKENEYLYMQHVRYAAVNLNFMVNLFTLVGDYNPERFFDVSPFAGLTYAHVFPHHNDDAYDTFGANAGLNFKFRLSNKFDFNLEGGVTLYPDDFDGHIGGSRSVDIVTQGTAGITYKIGKSTWEVAEPMNYGMVQDLNQRINDLKIQVQQANKPCPDCPPCPVTPVSTGSNNVVKNDQQIVFLPNPVFFRIDKSAIDAGEWSKIDKAADYLQTNPTANVVVTGYADRKTAYPAYNMRLSERRAKAVSKALIDKYGINPLRISINWEGDRVQPFDVNEWNRVVIFVIE